MNRGEKEKVLTVKVLAPEEEIFRYLEEAGDWKGQSQDHAGAAGSGNGQL